jgi:hypothetical protein
MNAMIRRAFTFVATGCSVILIAGAGSEAAGAITVSNLGNLPAFTSVISATDPFGEGRESANVFTTGTSATFLDEITLEMASAFATGGGFQLSLFSDNVGAPGVDLGVTFSGSTNPATAGQYSYTPTSSFTLLASTSYWVVATVPHVSPPDRYYRWLDTENLSESGEPGWSIGASVFWDFVGGSHTAWIGSGRSLLFSVEATAVPEPSLSLLLLGGCGALLLRRRTSC